MATVSEQLEAKISEYEQLKNEYDDFLESSAQIEKELEDNLAVSEQKCADLAKKKSIAEEKFAAIQEKYSQSLRDVSSMQTELGKIREKLSAVEENKRTLESANEDFREKVRILEATEEDLLHKLQHAEEEIIFLQSDIEELQTERIESEKRLKGELTDIQAELAQYGVLNTSQISETSAEGNHDSPAAERKESKAGNQQGDPDRDDGKLFLWCMLLN